MAKDARALLDHLAIEQVDVIGYSMGALVSTRIVPDEPSAPTRLSEIAVPTLVIAGDGDTLAGSPQLLAERIPGAVARIVHGDHLGAVADPALRDAITEFVSSASTM